MSHPHTRNVQSISWNQALNNDSLIELYLQFKLNELGFISIHRERFRLDLKRIFKKRLIMSLIL